MFERSCRRVTGELAVVPLPSSDAGVLDEIRALEELKCAAEARQARLAASLADVPGAGHQVALARRESPHRGRRHLSLARVLTRELPATMAAFTAGRISEWHATVLARETACLSRSDRAEVDRLVAGDVSRLESMSARQVADAARALACRLDPASVVTRRRRAEADRCVTLRPAPDCMAYVTALLPVAQGVGVWATLSRAAATAGAEGDPRGRGQVMADALVAAVTGQPGTVPAPSQVAVNLLVSDRVLLGAQEGAAHLDGYGPVPAELARELLTDSVRPTLRRLYCDPHGRIVAADARTRLFPRVLAGLIRLRDRTCRTPWCDAPVRHVDHVVDHADGGETSLENGQGLCEACNHTKTLPGWRSRPRPGPRHTVETTTPTGHTYLSQAPDPRPPQVASPAEIYYRDLVLAA